MSRPEQGADAVSIHAGKRPHLQGEKQADKGTIGAKVPRDWIDEIDEMVKEQGISDRSEFLRRILDPIVNRHRETKERARRVLTELLAKRPRQAHDFVLTRVEAVNGPLTGVKNEAGGQVK
jgi:Arc/MetJ-type ribon-helix-helix transcriptional regulator